MMRYSELITEGSILSIPDQALPDRMKDAIDIMTDPRPTSDLYQVGDVLDLHGDLGRVVKTNATSLLIRLPSGFRVVKRSDSGLSVADHSLWNSVQELDEAPISLNTIDMGVHHTSSFRDDDHKLHNSHKGQEKIKKVWHSSVTDVELYLIDVGITPEKALELATYGTNALSSDEDTEIADLVRFKDSITARPDVITLIYTQNEGSNRIPLTGWMIAHRLFHTFFEQKSRLDDDTAPLMFKANKIFQFAMGEITDICISIGFEQWKLPIACSIGTTKACRDFNLTQYAEFVPECFAQYMLSGNVKLKHLPKHLILPSLGSLPSVDRDISYRLDWVNYCIDDLEAKLNQKFGDIISQAKGKLFAL
jgi:hypothetical protein